MHQKEESPDLKLHPNGRFLYNVLPGINVISVMEINQETEGTAIGADHSF